MKNKGTISQQIYKQTAFDLIILFTANIIFSFSCLFLSDFTLLFDPEQQ